MESREFEQAVLAWFRQFWGSELDHFMIDVSALGGRYVLTLLALFAVGLMYSLGRRQTAAFALFAFLSGAGLMRALKHLIGRSRPPLPYPIVSTVDASFPSGHSMLSAVIYLTLALIVSAVIQRRRVRAFVIGAALLLVALIGVSRVYLGVHYPSDVVAGWSGGLIWALLCRWVESHWVMRAERRAAQRPDDGLPRAVVRSASGAPLKFEPLNASREEGKYS